MRIHIYILSVLITIFFVESASAQVLSRSEFKNASTIRLYVNDSTKNVAIARFAGFINKTGFTVSVPQTENNETKNNQVNKTGKPETIPPKLFLRSSQNGDTIMTNTATLYDFMMGDFEGKLKFYAGKDGSDQLYIAVSGYVSNSALGGNFYNLKMKKGGKDSNWAQRAMFKQLNNHLLSYPEVNVIMYSDQ
ncbi:MAG: hypothetical protein EOM83_15100 [Clostridia bacterium]|nr:hypothetical protein [Clostridia bacterium]